MPEAVKAEGAAIRGGCQIRRPGEELLLDEAVSLGLDLQFTDLKPVDEQPVPATGDYHAAVAAVVTDFGFDRQISPLAGSQPLQGEVLFHHPDLISAPAFEMELRPVGRR